MVPDNRRIGVRITIGKSGRNTALFMHPTAQNGTAQNSPHTIIDPKKPRIMSDLDPAKIGNAVLEILDLDKNSDATDI